MTVLRIGSAYVRLAAVAVGVGVLQAALETAAFALLYRDLLFAPYRFFTIQIYDAFTKLYFVAASVLPLPDPLASFLGQGVGAKLPLFADLAVLNVAVALVLAAVLLPVAPLLGVRADLDRGRYVARAVTLLAVVSIAVHLVGWAAAVKLPIEPTVTKVAGNLARDALLDGVAVALFVTLLAAAAAALVARSARASALALVAALMAAGAVGLRDWQGRVADAAQTSQQALATRTGGATAAAPSAGGHSTAAAPSAGGHSTAAAPSAGHNVVLVSIDSLRADHLGAYGYHRETSPAIDRLSREGALFEHCSSTTSWTLPAHMSLLTGRSILGHGVVGDDRRLDDGVPTLAEAFKAGGYATGAIVSAPYVSSRYGFAKGFDEYDDRTIAFETNEDSYKTVTAPLVNAAAETWIAAHADRPFFLFLHYWDVHYDYAPGPPYDRMFDPDYTGTVTGDDFYFSKAIHRGMDRRDLEHVIALYDGEIRLVDDHLAKLRDVLVRLGLEERTIFAVTADHGDEFFEHGEKGHHRTLYEEVVRVPCVLRAPGTKLAGRRIAAEASIIDFAPTLLGLTGVEAPRGLEGVDFTPALLGDEPEPRRPTFAELYRKGSLNVQVAALDERQKLIHHFNTRRLEAYDLRRDPGERETFDARAVPTTTLASLLLDWLNERWSGYRLRERTHGIDRVEIDDKTADMLRALGYVE